MIQVVKSFYAKLASSRLSGILFAAFSGLFFTLSRFYIQIAFIEDDRVISPVEIAFVQQLVASIALIPSIIYSPKMFAFPMSCWKSVLVLSAAECLLKIFVNLALLKAPVGDVVVIIMTATAMSGVLAFFLLQERIHWFDIFCIVITFVAVAIVVRPTFIFGGHVDHTAIVSGAKSSEHAYLIGIGFALLAAVQQSFYLVLTRKINATSLVVSFAYPNFIGTAIALILMPADYRRIRFEVSMAAAHCVMAGALDLLGMILMAIALDLEKAAVVSMVRTVDAVYAFLIEYFFAGIKPTLWAAFGGAMIILTVVVALARRSEMWDRCWAKKPTKESSVVEKQELY